MNRRKKSKCDDEATLPWSAIRRMLMAEEVSACHQTIAAAVEEVSACYGYAVRVCEIAFSFIGGVSLTWDAGDPSLGKFEPSSAFEAWLSRARRSPGKFLAYNKMSTALLAVAGEEEIPLYLLYQAEGEAPPEDAVATILSDIAFVSARQLYRLRCDAERRLTMRRSRSNVDTHTLLLRNNVDLIWQAGADGTIHVGQIFNGRADLAHRIGKHRLADLPISSMRKMSQLLKMEKPLRNIRLSQKDDHGNSLYVSFMPDPKGEGGYQGTLASGSDPFDDALVADVRLVEAMLDARSREDLARHEAEGMLLGLRILLAPAPFHEKIEKLARLISGTVGCEVMHIIHQRMGEKARLLAAKRTLPRGPAQALAFALEQLGEGRVQLISSEAEHAAAFRAALNMDLGNIALVVLPYGTERYMLLCQRRSGFGARDLSIMERFSLLLEQALQLHADQNQLIHTAKLSALGQMSTSLAHELRQPLNTISIAAQNLALVAESGAASSDMVQEKAGRILQQIDRACAVMDRMRRFGHKSSGDYRVSSLAALAHSARSLILSALGRSGVNIEIEIPEDAVALVNDLEIEQVLINLLQNSCDAISSSPRVSESHIRIWTGPDEDGSIIRMYVQDNGPGFAPDVLKYALDAFFSTKAPGEGTGLGLSISHTILREHQGRLHVGNAEGGGGLVTMFLRRPAADSQAVVIPFSRQGATPNF